MPTVITNNHDSSNDLAPDPAFQWDMMTDFQHMFPWATNDLNSFGRDLPTSDLGYHTTAQSLDFSTYGVMEQTTPSSHNLIQPLGEETLQRGPHEYGVFDISAPSSMFPHAHPSDDDALLVEYFSHVPELSSRTYEQVYQFYRREQGEGFESATSSFPDARYFNVFIQLYFEHFDAQMPFLHSTMIEEGEFSWILLLAVATIGCQYTSIDKRDQYSIALRDLLKRAILTHVSPFLMPGDVLAKFN